MKLHTSIVTAALGTLIVILPAAEAFAGRTMYIKPEQKYAIRRGTGTKYKIIQMVEIGSKVEVLKKTEGYTRIRLRNGREGWILSRFLESKEPAEQTLERVKTDNERLKTEQTEAIKKAAEATASLEETQKQFNSVLQERNTLLEKYQQLQADTQDVVNLRKEQQATARENEELQDQLNAARDANVLLKKGTQFKWYLAGAGVLLLGVLAGKIPAPRRKRKSFLS